MVEEGSSAQTNSSRWNARRAGALWMQVSVHYQITVSHPTRQHLSLHRVTILSGYNQMPFPVVSFTILTFHRRVFANP